MKSIKNSFSFLKNYLKYYKWQLVTELVCALISGFGAVGAIVGLEVAIQSIRDDNFAKTSLICGVILGFYVLNTFVQYLHYSINVVMAQKISKKIRNDLLIKLNKLPIGYFDKNQAGDIMSKFINDVNNISVFLSDNFSDLMSLLVWLCGLAIAMFVISWQLSLITIVLFACSILLVWWRIRKSLPYFNKLQKTLGEFTGFLEEKIAGQFIIDLFEQQNHVKKEFDEVHKRLNNLWENAQRISFQTYPLVDMLVNTITVVTMGIGVIFVLFKIDFVNFSNLSNLPDAEFNSKAIGSLTIFILISRNFISQMNQLPTIINIGSGTKIGIERVSEILNEKDEFSPAEKLAIEITLNKHNLKLDKVVKSEIIHVKPNVEFKNVKFEYIKNKPILKNISFKIESGEFIGIVGPTGSGKSTVINLLTKLYEINGGDILIDGLSIKKIKKDSLRKNIAIVLQDTFFFNLSIRDNIKIANPFATDQEVINACKQAYCHEIITKLPNGYDTIVGNFDNKISKGQKQLIAIARAIISKANLIILDEATSSVDVKTEIKVQKAMEYLLKNKTSILIAHRLSTVRNANKILVIKDGELIESGNHDQLLKKNGFYARLFNSQFDMID